MKRSTLTLLTGAALLLGACGSRTVIDDAQDAFLAECPGMPFGRLVSRYFITGLDSKTQWYAYAGETEDTKRITTTGKLQYVGVVQDATLTVIYNETRDELELTGLSLNGREQPYGLAEALVSDMCDVAKGLD